MDKIKEDLKIPMDEVLGRIDTLLRIITEKTILSKSAKERADLSALFVRIVTNQDELMDMIWG